MGSQQSQSVIPFLPVTNDFAGQVNMFESVKSANHLQLHTLSVPGEYKICLKNSKEARFRELIGLEVDA